MTGSLKYWLLPVIVAMVLVCGCRAVGRRSADRQDVPQMPATAISMSCLVRLYRADGSYYLTRQNHDIAPAEGAIRISGTEPDGSYVWQLTMGALASLGQPAAGMNWLPESLSPDDYCRLILGSFQAGTVGQHHDAAPVRIQGNWAYPVRTEHNLRWYQSRPGAAVADIVTLDSYDGRQYVARGYGYHLIRDTGVLVPAKIEIFMVDAAAMTEQLLMRLDYLN
ncbi:MAG TPA: hypothetical protein VLH60_05815 [Sedimentisphaerales bacterium]|nr:hypothetical protein [Sedimentisphaerales bacterium]